MHFKVLHRIEYNYNKPVFLEPQQIKLYPRCDNQQNVTYFNYSISPEPFCLSKHTDTEGNSTFEIWFHDLTDKLEIIVEMEVKTFRNNPFDYLPDTEITTLPINYNYLKEYNLLKPYTITDKKIVEEDFQQLKTYSDFIAIKANYNTADFLLALTKNLFNTISYEERPSGNPYPAIYTLTEKKGSCRDIAVLFNELCRIQGIASRFVSGYHLLKDNNRININSNNLHAWSEIYIPGGGWRGYDPTQGYVTDDRYLTIAASFLPELATPILGTFRKTDATSTFNYKVTISEVI